MIKAPGKEDIQRNEERWEKIHDVLKKDAKSQLKDKYAPITPAERKLLALLLEQDDFCGNISSWKPTNSAIEKLRKLGLIEEGFLGGGFRDWLADDVKRLIQDNEIKKAIYILEQFDPEVFEKIEAFLKDKENVFYNTGDFWLIKFEGKYKTIKNSKRLYFLIYLLDKPNTQYSSLKLYWDVHKIMPDRNKFDNEYRVRELKDINEKARTNVINNIKNAKKDLREIHPALYSHIDLYVKTGSSCRYIPPEDFEGWHIRI
jgi:hypothetical protein